MTEVITLIYWLTIIPLGLLGAYAGFVMLLIWVDSPKGTKWRDL